MKNKIHTLILLLSLFSASCGEVYDTAWSPSTNMRSLGLSHSELDFTHLAQSKSVEVRGSDIPWTFQNNAAWLQFSPSSGNAAASVQVSVMENGTDDARTAHAQLVSTDASMLRTFPLTVTQSAPEIVITVSQKEVTLDGSGSQVAVDVECSRSWTYSKTEAWLSVTRDGNRLLLSASANEGTPDREAYVNISAGLRTEQIHVRQVPANVTSTVSRLEFTNSAGSKQVTINADAPWSTQCSQAWIDVQPQSGQAGTQNLTIKVEASMQTEGRTGNVYVLIGSTRKLAIEVQQNGSQLSIAPSELEFEAQGHSQELRVYGNTPWRIDVSDPSWLHVNTTTGTGNATLQIDADANPGKQRSNSLMLYNTVSGTIVQTVTVVQLSAGFSVAPSQLGFNMNGGYKTMYITTNVDWRLTASEEWVTINPTSGKGNAEVEVTVASNPLAVKREANLTFRNATTNAVLMTLSVSQSASEIIESERSLGHTFLSSGESLKLSSFEQTDWTAEVMEGDSWITLSPTSGSASQQLTITTKDNPSGKKRTGRIRVLYGLNSYTCPVEQAGKTIQLSNTLVRFFAKGGKSASIVVTADKTPSISTSATWLTVNQVGKAFTLEAEKNTGSEKREATVTITLPGIEDSPSEVVTVSQAGVNANIGGEGYDDDKNWN